MPPVSGIVSKEYQDFSRNWNQTVELLEERGVLASEEARLRSKRLDDRYYKLRESFKKKYFGNEGNREFMEDMGARWINSLRPNNKMNVRGFRYFESSDWDKNGCAYKASKIQSLYPNSQIPMIEDWELIGRTNNDDWDINRNFDDITGDNEIPGRYIILRKYGKGMYDVDAILILQSNGDIKRGGSRFLFRCVNTKSRKVKSRKAPKSRKASKSKSKKRCPNGSKRKGAKCVRTR